MSRKKREKMKLKERRHQKEPEVQGKAAPVKAAEAKAGAAAGKPAAKLAAEGAAAGKARPEAKPGARPGAAHAKPAPAAEPPETPKRRGRPAGSRQAGAAQAGAERAVKAAHSPPVEATATAAPPRRSKKAAAAALRQAEEEALELQKLTAPHIPGCSQEWQQFYLKVRQAAVSSK